MPAHSARALAVEGEKCDPLPKEVRDSPNSTQACYGSGFIAKDGALDRQAGDSQQASLSSVPTRAACLGRRSMCRNAGT